MKILQPQSDQYNCPAAFLLPKSSPAALDERPGRRRFSGASDEQPRSAPGDGPETRAGHGHVLARVATLPFSHRAPVRLLYQQEAGGLTIIGWASTDRRSDCSLVQSWSVRDRGRPTRESTARRARGAKSLSGSVT